MKATTQHINDLDDKLTKLVEAISIRIDNLEKRCDTLPKQLNVDSFFDQKIAEKLHELGYHTIDLLKAADRSVLLGVKGWGDKTVTEIMEVTERV